jgi:hypothetical protein
MTTRHVVLVTLSPHHRFEGTADRLRRWASPGLRQRVGENYANPSRTVGYRNR